MPLRPEMRPLYPETWTSDIAIKVRSRAGDRCECLGECEGSHQGRCKAVMPHMRMTKSHDCQDPSCSDLAHIKLRCGACHIRYDSLEEQRALRARLELERLGQMRFDDELVKIS